MIFVGIDDTDIAGSRGTNQLAKAMVRELAPRFTCRRIVRHQLLDDPRVPYTSKNGSASLVFDGDHSQVADLAANLKRLMLADFIPGSDPGLCVTSEVSPAVIAFARRCEEALVAQAEAFDMAKHCGLYLEGLGGTHDGVIGALAAVGFAGADDGGRVVQWEQWPDDLTGPTPASVIAARDIHIRRHDNQAPVEQGLIDVGKHLRPNWRQGKCVLFVLPDNENTAQSPGYRAVKLV